MPIAIRLLVRLLPLAERGEVSQDLAAEFAARRSIDGALRAQLWLWMQLLRSLAALTARSWMRATTGFEPRANAMNPGGPIMERWLLDARYAVRRLRTRPLYTAVAVLTLAIGAGGLAAISGIVRTLLVDPLPFPHADALVQFWRPGDWRAREVTALRNEWSGFTGVAAYRPGDVTLERDGQPARLVPGISASSELFDVLGVPPLMGRGFERGEDLPGAAPVAVVSYGLWRDLGADPHLVGSTIALDGVPRTVVGVMPKSFWFPDPTVDVWTTDTITATGGVGFYALVGRMAPGRRIENMAPAIDHITTLLRSRFTYTKQWDITENATLSSLRDPIVRPMKPALLATLVGMGVILLIACANVGALVLGQIESRSTELAVRTALGADRSRVATQIVIELLVLGIVAAVLSVAVASAAMPVLRGALPLGAWRDRATVDGTVLVACGVVTVLAALVIALLPILALCRGDVRDALSGARTNGVVARRGELQSAMIVGEVALTVLLACVAGLLVRSVANLYDVRPGIETDGVAVLDVATPSGTAPADRLAMMRTVLAEIAALPGVEHAAVTQRLPLRGPGWSMGLRLPNAPADAPSPKFRIVSKDYFATMGIPLERGRTFASTDRATDSVVAIVVNESLVKLYFPNVDPIGQTMLGGFGKSERIVGVVGNAAEASLTDPMPPARYYLDEQTSFVPSGESIAIRATRPTDVARLLGDARRIIARAAPSMAIQQATTMARVLDVAVGPARDVMRLLSLLTAVALTLGVIGIYGVISQFVARRRRDWGIRVALGLSPARVARLIVRRGTSLVGVGVIVGLVAALLSARVMQSFMFGVSSHDPVTFAGAASLLLLAGVAASAIPALRAARVDPVTVLREQ